MANETKIVITANAAQAKGELNSFGGTLEGIGKKIISFSGIAGALSIGAFAAKLVSVQREFDILNSSLITVTGSAENAKLEFAWIKDFAATTPYQLNEVTSAFVKMKALGLDASRESLNSYGNTASAMGKSLNQMIEAVADAATGEFERLKEFGIKARKNGDEVSLTFKGVTTTVRNSAAEITDYLQGLGNNDFAGAMALRAATLDGAISNLADTWDGLFRTITSGNVGGEIADGVRTATGAVQDLDGVLAVLNQTTKNNSSEVMSFKDEITFLVLGVSEFFKVLLIGGKTVGLAFHEVALFINAAGLQAYHFATGKWREIPKDFEHMAKRMAEVRDEYTKDVTDITSSSFVFGNPQPPAKAAGGGTTTDPAAAAKAAAAEAAAKAAKSAAEAAAKAAIAIRKQETATLLSLQKQAIGYQELSAVEQTRWEIENGAYQKFSEQKKQELLMLAQGIDLSKAAGQATKDSAKAQDDANKELQRSALEAQAIIFDIDPIAKVSAEWEKLTALKEQGLLTDEQIGKSYAKTFENIGKDGSDAFKSLENAVRGWGTQFTDEMTRMVRTGKMDFASLADSIINDLLRIQIQKNITDKLVTGGTGFLDGIFGGMFGGGGDYSSVADGALANANGNVFSGPGISAYSGSVVNKPTLFPFARGTGLMGEAGPEAILPLTRINGKLGVQAQGGGAPVTVNIINAPTGTQVQQRPDGNGGMTLDVIIEQIEGGIARNVSRGTGALNGALTQTFGLNRTAGAMR